MKELTGIEFTFDAIDNIHRRGLWKEFWEIIDYARLRMGTPLKFMVYTPKITIMVLGPRGAEGATDAYRVKNELQSEVVNGFPAAVREMFLLDYTTYTIDIDRVGE